MTPKVKILEAVMLNDYYFPLVYRFGVFIRLECLFAMSNVMGEVESLYYCYGKSSLLITDRHCDYVL